MIAAGRIKKILIIVSVCLMISISHAQRPIAVVEFEGKNISQSEASILTDRLRNELFRIGEFDVLERELMQQILMEQDFQLSGCASDECLVEVGKLVGVREIVGGSVGKVGNVITVSARLVDVETGMMLKVTDYDYEGEIGDLLKSGMEKIAMELSGQRVSEQKDVAAPTQADSQLLIARYELYRTIVFWSAVTAITVTAIVFIMI